MSECLADYISDEVGKMNQITEKVKMLIEENERLQQGKAELMEALAELFYTDKFTYKASALLKKYGIDGYSDKA